MDKSEQEDEEEKPDFASFGAQLKGEILFCETLQFWPETIDPPGMVRTLPVISLKLFVDQPVPDLPQTLALFWLLFSSQYQQVF